MEKPEINMGGGETMRLVILTENTVNKRGLLAEHGLSVLVEAAGRRILFDTGQSGVYLHNAGRLKEDLNGLDGIVLSHGHYDHTGGLPEFPHDQLPPVFVREKAFEEKLTGSRERNAYRDIGIPWLKKRSCEQMNPKGKKAGKRTAWRRAGRKRAVKKRKATFTASFRKGDFCG